MLWLLLWACPGGFVRRWELSLVDLIKDCLMLFVCERGCCWCWGVPGDPVGTGAGVIVLGGRGSIF